MHQSEDSNVCKNCIVRRDPFEGFPVSGMAFRSVAQAGAVDRLFTAAWGKGLEQ